MIEPLYDLGMRTEEINSQYDVNLFDDLLISDTWEVEKDKSSKINIIPASGLVTKEKQRTLNKTVYEVFSMMYFSELLKTYGENFKGEDFTLYSPAPLRFQYGEKGKKDSMRSVIYEFFCPGTPLNQKDNKKEREYSVQTDPVRVGDRVMYLSGIFAEILAREGVIHGDPQLRHFILLPKKGKVMDVNRDNKIYSLSSRNGLGVIDLEHARLEGPNSKGVEADIERFKKRLFGKFKSNRAKEYFDKGKGLVKTTCDGFSARDSAYHLADRLFRTRLVDRSGKIDKERVFKKVDMEKMMVKFYE